MGLFHSSPANNSEEQHSLGPHGSSLAPRRGRRLNWWEVLKLGAVTVSVGALQWLKMYFLMLEDREAQQRLRRRLGRHSRQEQQQQQQEQKNFASNLSPESRQAVISMIDHIVTPMLVDQWRLGLVKVLLDPEDGPVLPEEDPDTRKALLASLQSYQSERDARPTFRPGSVPARYNRPSAQSSQASHRQAQGHSEASSSMARGREALAMASLAQTSQASDVFAEHQPSGSTPAPSAPPLYPEVQQPSAPPLSADWQLVEAQREKEVQELEECGVCLDAKVEVEIDMCHHKLCCECAKAICCLEGRAPQCPFCRGPMTGVTAVATG